MIEKELLFIVVVLEQFRSMLFGAKLFIYSDHKNVSQLILSPHLCFGNCLWKSMAQPSSITLLRKISLLIHFCTYPITMCCQFQGGEWTHCSLQIYIQTPQHQQQPWIVWVFPKLNLTWDCRKNPVDLKWIYTNGNRCTGFTTRLAKYHDCYFNKNIDGCVIVWYALSNEDCNTQWKLH